MRHAAVSTPRTLPELTRLVAMRQRLCYRLHYAFRQAIRAACLAPRATRPAEAGSGGLPPTLIRNQIARRLCPEKMFALVRFDVSWGSHDPPNAFWEPD